MGTIYVDRGTIYTFRIVFNVNTASGDVLVTKERDQETARGYNNTVTNVEMLK